MDGANGAIAQTTVDEPRLEELRRFCATWDLEPTPEMLHVLQEAFTSVPYARQFRRVPSNRWLEWVGDAVWADEAAYFLATAPELVEWNLLELERAHGHLCSGRSQLRMALRVGIDHLLLVPDGFKPYFAGKKLIDRATLVADALEAVVGAIHSVQPGRVMGFVERCIAPSLSDLRRREARDPWSWIAPFSAPTSRAEWVGIFVARTILTTGIARQRKKGFGLYDAHELREESMRLLRKSLSLTATILGLRMPSELDEVGVRALLQLFGKAHQLPDYIKIIRETTDIDEVIPNARQSLRAYRDSNPSGHMQALNVFLRSSPHTLVLDRQGIRTTLWCNGIKLGESTNANPTRAEEEAASMALHHPELPRLRDGR